MSAMSFTAEKRARDLGERSSLHKARVYFFPKGEDVVQNLAARYSRPYKAYKEMLPAIFAQCGVDAKTKVNWSQNAGCSCGCSPGFILSEQHGFDIFVDIE